ncbi:hypothetical protein [Rhizobium sp. 11515TR]|uniref:hypothetical protein n=1 Tax=Rhizobium sp. 11515TR TaxID=2028343 RepID=UPI000BA8BBAC|nr:hypothetical protein [Rhizobium sp. 11515TR]ASW06262.1 hypothetical protein CKA34_10455 [Rhizobium sp. 11515TR]
MSDEYEALRAYAHEATKVITGLAGGGSENFSGQIGDMFKADLEFCAKKIRDRHEMMHGLIVKAKKTNDALLEALKAMLEEYEGIYDSVDKAGNRWQSDEAANAEVKARDAIAKAEGRS